MNRRVRANAMVLGLAVASASVLAAQMPREEAEKWILETVRSIAITSEMVTEKGIDLDTAVKCLGSVLARRKLSMELPRVLRSLQSINTPEAVAQLEAALITDWWPGQIDIPSYLAKSKRPEATLSLIKALRSAEVRSSLLVWNRVIIALGRRKGDARAIAALKAFLREKRGDRMVRDQARIALAKLQEMRLTLSDLIDSHIPATALQWAGFSYTNYFHLPRPEKARGIVLYWAIPLSTGYYDKDEPGVVRSILLETSSPSHTGLVEVTRILALQWEKSEGGIWVEKGLASRRAEKAEERFAAERLARFSCVEEFAEKAYIPRRAGPPRVPTPASDRPRETATDGSPEPTNHPRTPSR